MTQEENNCYFISSFGIAKSMDQPPFKLDRNGALYNFNFNNSYGEKIYVRIVDVDKFFQSRCPDLFKEPFILVTGDMDTTVPDDIQNCKQYLDHPKLLKWYGQNVCKNNFHSKLKQIPIGLDYHTLNLADSDNHDWGLKMSPIQQEQLLLEIKHELIPIQKTNYKKAVTNFHHSTFGYPIRRQQYREPILNKLKNNKCIIWLPKQTRTTFWKSCNSCSFVICPFGNGLDTHRTWEVLILGRIPIIPKSELNSIFEGLPYIEMEDNEWNEITEEWLYKKYLEIVSNWDNYKWERLSLKYWCEQIK